MVMNHETAIDLHAAERYCAGELTTQERDGFEEHFFMCPECAEEVRWEKIFSANAKAAFEQEIREPLFFRQFSGPVSQPLVVSRGERLCAFSLPAPDAIQSYTCEILDAAGSRKIQQSLGFPPQPANHLHIAVPVAALEAGDYDLLLLAESREILRCRLRITG